MSVKKIKVAADKNNGDSDGCGVVQCEQALGNMRLLFTAKQVNIVTLAFRSFMMSKFCFHKILPGGQVKFWKIWKLI